MKVGEVRRVHVLALVVILLSAWGLWLDSLPPVHIPRRELTEAQKRVQAKLQARQKEWAQKLAEQRAQEPCVTFQSYVNDGGFESVTVTHEDIRIEVLYRNYKLLLPATKERFAAEARRLAQRCDGSTPTVSFWGLYGEMHGKLLSRH